MTKRRWVAWVLVCTWVSSGCGGSSSGTCDDCPPDGSLPDATVADAARDGAVSVDGATSDAAAFDAGASDGATLADAATGSAACHALMRCAAACSACEIEPCSGSAPLIDEGCVAGCAPESWDDPDARALYQPLADCYEASLGALWDAPRRCAEPLAACCTSSECLGTLPDPPTMDAGGADAEVDAGPRDAGMPTRDAGMPTRDAGTPDAGSGCEMPAELSDLRVTTCDAAGTTRVSFVGPTSIYAYETATGPTAIPRPCGVGSRTLVGAVGTNRVELPGGPSSLGECWTWRLCAVDASCTSRYSPGVLVRECVQAGPGGTPTSMCSLPRE